MSLFSKYGNEYRMAEQTNFTDRLPAGTFTISVHPMTGELSLVKVDDMVVRNKIYGKSLGLCDRIFNTFTERPSATGVLLDGEKGSGKTLLTKLLSSRAREEGIPTIIINQPLAGENFNSFIQKIDQPAVIIFDEFEKNYRDSERQDQLLTLLDGVYPTKKLFVLTSNDKYRVNNHMINRPGRIFYFIEYRGLDKDFIREYCEDTLLDKSHTDGIVTVSSLFEQFNFDLLQALVEEVNRYGEKPIVAMELLNAKPFNDSRGGLTYDIKILADGIELPVGCHNTAVRMNPLGGSEWINVYMNNNDDELSSADEELASDVVVELTKLAVGRKIRASYDLRLTPESLVLVDPLAGKYMYEIQNEGVTFNVMLSKQQVKTYRWQDAF